MNNIRRCSVLLVALIYWSGHLYCQDPESPDKTIPQLGEDLGNIVDPGLVGEDPDIRARTLRAGKAQLFFSLSAVDAEGAFLSGLILGGSRGTTQADLRYLNVGADDGSSNRDQFRFRIKQAMFKSKLRPGFALAAVGQHVDTKDSSQQDTFLLSGAWEPREAPRVNVFVNLGWSEKRPEQGKNIAASLIAVGTSFKFDALSIAIDYALENKISNADDASLNISHSIPPGAKLNFGVSKGGTVFASYMAGFN